MLTGGVIEAQVIASLRAQSQIEGQPQTTLIFLEAARVAFSRQARDTLKAYRRMWPEAKIAVLPYISRWGEAAAAKSLTTYLTGERLNSSPIIFHCRGPQATSIAYRARCALGKGRVIFDLRGAGAYEAIHRLGFPQRQGLSPKTEQVYSQNLVMEQRAVAVADWVFVVSPGLVNYAVEQLHADPDRVLVVPSCVSRLAFDEGVRQKIRTEWGVGDAPVFVYSGRLGPERLPEHLFRVFAAARQVDERSRLIIFSYLNELHDLPAWLDRAGVPSSAVMVKSDTRDNVFASLCAADVGMLFLEDAARFVDFALPIKIPEYLAAGLPLIVNRHVGRVPELVESRQLGWVIDPSISDEPLMEKMRKVVTSLTEEREDLRQRALETSRELFLWENHVPAIRRAYGLYDQNRAN